ncbi:DUF1376 domain-containing protein [Acinetobacter sp. ANC 4640]
MHYYSFNPKDYMSKTAFLEPMEDLAYRRMLDHCYLTELPLPEDVSEIAMLIRMRSHTESIKVVLHYFFELTPQGYVCDRIARELAAYHSKSEKAKASADARWNKHRNKIKDLPKSDVECKSDANALRNECERIANNKPLTNNHKPITINQEPIINNLKNKNDWLDFEKLRVDFESAYPNLDFDVIKSSDWFEREKLAFEKFNANRDFDEAQMIYHFADRLANVFKTKYSESEIKTQAKSQAKKSNFSEKQIHVFAQKLANHPEVSSKFAEVGESQERFTARLAMKLSDPEQRKKLAPYLAQVGFEGAVA